MPKKLTLEEVKQRLYEVHGDVVVLDDTTYIDTMTKCLFVDEKYGEWWAKPNKVIWAKHSHPKRKSEKIKETCLKKYGVKNVASLQKRKYKDINELEKELYAVHKGKVSVDVSTFTGMNNKACFTDKEHGEWWARPSNVVTRGQVHPKRVSEKKEKTNIEKFGFKSPMNSPEMAKRVAQSQNNSKTLKHWFSNEEIVCVGSYEIAVVQYFNANKIDYLWQVQTFLMPDGRTYTPDCYLPDEDLWIEIKGYFRNDAEEKWNWFQKEYPNCELWNGNALREKKII